MPHTKSCSNDACPERNPQPITSFHPLKRGGFRAKCRTCTNADQRQGRAAVGSENKTPPQTFQRELKRGKRFIVTSAQNNTLVHEEFFATLLVAAKHLDAELVVVPYRYKNPTGMQPGKDLRECERPLGVFVQKKDEPKQELKCRRFVQHDGPCSKNPDPIDELWWDPRAEPFLHNVREKLCENLVLAADVKIQPTATSPLTGFESLTGAESCIIGHPKMQFRTVSTVGRFPKILTTTGACTVRNYSNTKAGALGEFHHFLGATMVEIDGDIFHLRQLNADREDGSFIDIDKLFTVNGVEKAPPALGLIVGDSHVRVTDPQVDAATYGPSGMVEAFNPKTIVFHDVLDGETVNPHDEADPFIAEAKRRAGRVDIKAEVQEVVDFVNARAKGRDAVIVESNHHDFLRRWIVSADWKKAGPNRRFYLETALHMIDSVRMGPGGAQYDDPFCYWAKRLGAQANIRLLGSDESFRIAEVECSLHGHRGPNGARGSLKNLSRLGTKTCIAHGHGPGIEEGGYQVGTSTGRLAYEKGPSNHLQTHCAIYGNGKRTLVTVVNDRWRLRS